MPIQIDQIQSILTRRGYRVIHETRSKRGFQFGSNLPIYLNLKSKTGKTTLIAHPDSGVEALRDQRPDLIVDSNSFNSSNMQGFPRRVHTGATAIAWGWGLTFESLHAVEACLGHLEGKPGGSKGVAPAVRAADEDSPSGSFEPRIGADLPVDATRRDGQDSFREDLLAYWKSCAVTGVKSPRLLRASHIKPWAIATPEEKGDLYNGLLLAPQLDAAFDVGLITFDDDGRVVLSPQLSPADAELLGLNEGLRLRRVDAQHRPYLAFHRQQIFSR